ncbi:MAG: DUF4388 domain-containing protein [Cyanobacteria bacterium SZAS LIN-2]|nr:DUF4388 domain-containing protein [Cyanobacteria bacterium SZAS LIN-2]
MTLSQIDTSFPISLGFVLDRTALNETPICSCFCVGDDIWISVASVLAPYRAVPNALEIIDIKTGEKRSINSIAYHPHFDYMRTVKALEYGGDDTFFDPFTETFNCCLLRADKNNIELSSSDIDSICQALRFPVDLTNDDFRGSLKDIDLSLVLQTLKNAFRSGILFLCDDLMRPRAQIFCAEGQPVMIRFQHLIDEMALYQIIQKQVATRFAFYPSTNFEPKSAKLKKRALDMLLLEAFRRQDELVLMGPSIRADSDVFVRNAETFDEKILSPETALFGRAIFESLDGCTTIDDLWTALPCDDYTIYRAIYELWSNKFVSKVNVNAPEFFSRIVSRSDANSVAESPQDIFADTRELKPGADIVGIYIDPLKLGIIGKTGHIVSSSGRENGNFVHDIKLLPYSAGAPILQNGRVVGMHCGLISQQANGTFDPHQIMLPASTIVSLKKDQKWLFAARDHKVSSTEIVNPTQAAGLAGPSRSATALPAIPKKTNQLKRFAITCLCFIVGYLFVILIDYISNRH